MFDPEYNLSQLKNFFLAFFSEYAGFLLIQAFLNPLHSRSLSLCSNCCPIPPQPRGATWRRWWRTWAPRLCPAARQGLCWTPTYRRPPLWSRPRRRECRKTCAADLRDRDRAWARVCVFPIFPKPNWGNSLAGCSICTMRACRAYRACSSFCSSFRYLCSSLLLILISLLSNLSPAGRVLSTPVCLLDTCQMLLPLWWYSLHWLITFCLNHLQTIADWQILVIRALTNTLEDICCSSRCACDRKMAYSSSRAHTFYSFTLIYRPRSSRTPSGCQPGPGSASLAVWSALLSSAPSCCSSLSLHPVWTRHSG